MSAHAQAIRQQALEDAVRLLRGVLEEHYERAPGHREPGRWCEDFGCSTLEDLAWSIEALADVLPATGDTRTSRAAERFWETLWDLREQP